jgi:hypothetical protein
MWFRLLSLIAFASGPISWMWMGFSFSWRLTVSGFLSYIASTLVFNFANKQKPQ